MNTPEQAVGDLAIGLGQLIAAEHAPPERDPAYKCFVESVLVLAFHAGVSKEKAIQPFDVFTHHATTIWDTLEKNK